MGASVQMKSSEIVNEIVPLPQQAFMGGADSLELFPDDRRRIERNAKPLPGGSGLFYKVTGNTDGMTINIIDKDHPNRAIAELILLTDVRFPIKRSAMVSSIEVDEDYRGVGLAKALYGIAMSILNYTLIAGESQTPGGRRNWVSLYNIPNVTIQGYIMVEDYLLNNDNKFIDRIMNIGSDYLGKITDENRSLMHVFAFPLTIDRAQLKNAIADSDIKLYSKRGHPSVSVGMFAQWKS
jgi:hypothetical protein